MTSGYGTALVQSIVALAGVCTLAVFLLRLAARRGLGRPPKGKGLELVERLPLDARSAVCVVRAGDRQYLVGTGDGAAPTLLAELPAAPGALAVGATSEGTRSFRELLGTRDPNANGDEGLTESR